MKSSPKRCSPAPAADVLSRIFSRQKNCFSFWTPPPIFGPRASLRPRTYYTLFGLLATTGLRISEAMRLTVDDVTTDGLIVRNTKFRKNRMLPLHETTQAVLNS